MAEWSSIMQPEDKFFGSMCTFAYWNSIGKIFRFSIAYPEKIFLADSHDRMTATWTSWLGEALS